MATRAIPVVVERSPGGASGWWIKVGERTGIYLSCSEWTALGKLREELIAVQMDRGERGRVERLVLRELDRKRSAEVTAEVSL